MICKKCGAECNFEGGKYFCPACNKEYTYKQTALEKKLLKKAKVFLAIFDLVCYHNIA